MTRDEERLHKRRARLMAMTRAHPMVCQARKAIYARGRRPEVVVVRPDFIYTPDTRELSTPMRRPPITGLLTPHGIALQTYLVALFEAQARRLAGTTPINDRPIVAAERTEIGWLDLVASPALANPSDTKERATEKDNRLRQLKAALRTLHQSGLVALKGDRFRNGRFEGFELHHESGAPGLSGFTSYKIPNSIAENAVRLSTAVRLPAAFFLRGWVHMLSPSEIATYLMLRHLARRYPGEHAEAGIYISGGNREDLYGLTRDVYESHRALTSFGLIELMPDVTRRPDGRVRHFQERVRRGEAVLPHRFKILDDETLDRNALTVVQNHLKRRLASMH